MLFASSGWIDVKFGCEIKDPECHGGILICDWIVCWSGSRGTTASSDSDQRFHMYEHYDCNDRRSWRTWSRIATVLPLVALGSSPRPNSLEQTKLL